MEDEKIEITADNYKEIVDQVRDEYEAKLKASEDARKADAKEYANSILNNQHKEDDAGDEDLRHGLPSGKEMKKIYMGLDPVLTSNLDRMTCLMNWRDAELLDDPDNDICLTHASKDGAFTEDQMRDQKASVERTCDVIKQCIEESHGDNGVFTSMLQSRCNDPAIVKSMKK